MSKRPYLCPTVWEEAEKEELVPAPLIKYKDKTAVSDEYHVEMWGASGGGSMYTGNLAIIEGDKVTEFIYGHRYTDEDFLKFLLIPKKLDDYLRRSSFGKEVA
tara:strand:- start:805 stop:1113 length:309 start_codon:yes stop_codon:yes gene_type:complete